MRSSTADRRTRTTTRLDVRAALLGGLALASVGLTGCQVDIGGQTLPSAYYLQDDIQYFPAGPEFKLSKEAAALKAATPVPADGCCN
ncbi:MAG: hypothetical protein WCH79_00370 [Planctomycetia bacterium]